MSTLNNIKKSKMGRPEVDSEAITLRLPRDIITALEAFRREQEIIPTRPEAIRLLLKDYLNTLGYMPNE